MGYAGYRSTQPRVAPRPIEAPAKTVAAAVNRDPVPLNRSPDVMEGYRGELHPLLRRAVPLELSGAWTTVGKGRDKLHLTVPPSVYALFLNLALASERRTYHGRDLSCLLPKDIPAVGQMWALEADGVTRILRQFHPKASLRLQAKGRRAGPDGAFGILRAVSPRYLDIVFRIHAEFELTPARWEHPDPLDGAWFTPAFLAGRMLIDREAGNVAYLRIALPDRTLNVHLTVSHPLGDIHDIVRVERMALEGGQAESLDNIAWSKEIDVAAAHRRLEKQFYKFMEIDWVPPARALELARERNKPLLAMVLWGALDDQSC
jgi:hypothetical protein